jgi:hypothetical protein
MWEPYQQINLSDSAGIYETMWKEERKEMSRGEAIFEQKLPAPVKLRNVWPRYAHVKLLVHGKYRIPTWAFDNMSNSKVAESDFMQQFMDYEVIGVSVYSKGRNSNVTDIKIEVRKPGYQIGDPIPA